MKNVYFFIYLLLLPFLATSQSTQPAHQIFLLGNFVDITDHALFQKNLTHLFDNTDQSFTLILNGDLVNRKMSDSNNDDLLLPIRAVMDLVEKYPKGSLLIVAGDRDWNASKKGGQKSIENLQERLKNYRKSKAYKRIKWLTKDGCPGPETFEINDNLTIIGMDSQWWNHPYDKPRPSDAACPVATPEKFAEELEEIINKNKQKNVLLVGHHPFYSLGNYGGNFSLATHLLPVPLIGSFKAAYSKNIGSVNDISNERLTKYANTLNTIFASHDNLIFAGGHEKNQQIIRQHNNYLLNSGAPMNGKYATEDSETWLSTNQTGLLELTYTDNGEIRAGFLHFQKTEQFQLKENFILYHAICGGGELPKTENILYNTAFVPCRPASEAAAKMSRPFDKPTEAIASKKYEAGVWKRFWFGNHYRTTWAAPVQAPYLNLDTTFNGLTIYQKGNSKQKMTLRLRAKNGTIYNFRSLQENLDEMLDYRLQTNIVSDVLRDQVATQNPYSPLIVDPLLNELDILHASPQLYVLPDDAKLGIFRAKYGNLFGFLEEKPGKFNLDGEIFGAADNILSTNKLIDELFSENSHEVSQKEFVRARLFDVLIGDWGRQEDNWKWAAYKKKKTTKYRPIPRDRDHAFSKQDGLVSWLADRSFGLPQVEGFRKEIKGMKSLMYQARHLDRFVATEADRETWEKQAKFIQEQISEADIEAAVAALPAEVRSLSGDEIAEKLKIRLADLHEYANEYYEILAKEVEVIGSNKKDIFVAEYLENGDLKVTMYDDKNGEKGKKKLYQRTFKSSETKRVRIYGLGNDDTFEITGNADKGIQLDVFGGPGDDKFEEDAAVKTNIWDKGGQTVYNLNGNGKKVNYWNKNIYEYDRKRFDYQHILPQFYLNYNRFTGFGAALGMQVTTQNFKKEDYAQKHFFGVALTSEKNKSVFYEGRFHQVIKEWDIIVDAGIANPSMYNNFFGYGNESRKDDEAVDAGFNRTDLDRTWFSAGIGRAFWKNSSLDLMVGFERFESEELEQFTILNREIEYLGKFETFNMLPISLALDLDFRDEKIQAYNGTRAFFKYENSTILNQDNQQFGILEGILEYYFSTKTTLPVTFGLKIGGATSHGDVPFYKSPSLGSTNGLRGYFQNRFTDESLLFFNAELRFQFVEKQSASLPVKCGLEIFYDRGRVFGDGDSDEWHVGYGAGFYFLPFSESFRITVSLAFSREENFFPMIGVGTRLGDAN